MCYSVLYNFISFCRDRSCCFIDINSMQRTFRMKSINKTTNPIAIILEPVHKGGKRISNKTEALMQSAGNKPLCNPSQRKVIPSDHNKNTESLNRISFSYNNKQHKIYTTQKNIILYLPRIPNHYPFFILIKNQ